MIKSIVELDVIDKNQTVTQDEIETIIQDFSEPFGIIDETLMKVRATPIGDGYEPKVTID